MTRAAACLLAAGIGTMATIASAAIPQEFSYQAYLTDTAGQPIVAGSVDVTVSFWDSPVAGTQLGTTQSFTGLDLLASRGFVNVTVPTASLTPADLNGDIYLEVTVDDGGGVETLAPRQKVVAAPTALNADALDGIDSADLVQLSGAQTVTGTKTFTAIQRLNVPNVNTSASGTTGAAFNITGTSIDPAATRAIGTRGAVTHVGTPEPGGLSAPTSVRSLQGVVGAVNSEGGTNTTLGGGYFIAKLLSSSTDGAYLISGVSADAEAEAGATLNPGQTMVGGRFGVENSTSGPATTVGTLATSLGTGGALGPAAGAVAIGGGSASSNIGVLAAANADPFALPGLIAPNASPQGIGVYGFNNIPGGTAVLADNGGTGGDALRAIGTSSLEGDVTITGKATQTVLTPTAAGDLTTKDYVDTAFGNFTRTYWVIPSGAGATPDGTLANPYDDLVAAYADAKTIGGSFYNRVAIVLTPGRHSISSQLVLDTVGVDIMGFGPLSTHLDVSADPGIVMNAPTSGSYISNINLNAQTSPATNVILSVQGSGIVQNVNFRRPGAATAGSLVTVALPASATFSFNGFQNYGGVTITSYGAQTTFTDGFILGDVISTGTSTGAEFVSFSNCSALANVSFTPATFGILLMNNVAQCNAISYNAATVFRASGSNFATTAGVPVALPDPAASSAVISSVGDTSGWTGIVAASAGNVPTAYTAFTLK
ncbi:MAG: hypothetical protein PWP23_679 [Candidatus Sumerlaeota bacterium]|nr:hypothetical protein [Candidatus Sumerlaeota bacterium]